MTGVIDCPSKGQMSLQRCYDLRREFYPRCYGCEVKEAVRRAEDGSRGRLWGNRILEANRGREPALLETWKEMTQAERYLELRRFCEAVDSRCFEVRWTGKAEDPWKGS